MNFLFLTAILCWFLFLIYHDDVKNSKILFSKEIKRKRVLNICCKNERVAIVYSIIKNVRPKQSIDTCKERNISFGAIKHKKRNSLVRWKEFLKGNIYNDRYYFLQPCKIKEWRDKKSTVSTCVDKKYFFGIFAKMPVITINRKLYPKPFSTDYENILRKFDVAYINYKTTLRDKKEIDIRAIDDLYGKIYDRNVLKKQFFFFLYNDDINTCHRILTENRNVLTKEESFKILNSLPYIFYNHLEYVYPNEKNVDTVLKKLLKTYIFQYANDKNIDYLNFHYRYNKLDEYCEQLQREYDMQKKVKAFPSTVYKEVIDNKTKDDKKESTNRKENIKEENEQIEKEQTENEEKIKNIKEGEGVGGEGEGEGEAPIWDNGDIDYETNYKKYKYNYDIIEITKKYKDLMKKFENYPTLVKLEKVQILYTKILSMKASKIYEGFRKHESIKRNDERKLYRNARLKLETNKLTPYMKEPIKMDVKKKEEINKLFEKYVEEKDLKNACLIIRKYTNMIDTKEVKSRELIRNFLKLHDYIYTCGKYNEKELAFLRMIYYSTVRKQRVIVKVCEAAMRDQGENVTHKEVYEKQLNAYRERRNKMFDERMKAKNIDMEKIRDFSSTYPMEWLPVLYKDLFEEIEKERSQKTISEQVLKKKKASVMDLFGPNASKGRVQFKGAEKQKGEKMKENEKEKDKEQKEKEKEKEKEEGRFHELKIGKALINFKKIEKGKKKKGKGGKKKETSEAKPTEKKK